MKYDIIIVLCPEKKNPEDGKFPNYINGVYLGGQIRMDAAVNVFEKNKETEFIMVGGYDKNGEGSQKIDDMNEFLVNKCPNIKINKRPSLPCTFHNLVAIFNIWRNYSLNLKDKNIGLLTNSYHLPRALRFWNELVTREEFKSVFIPSPIPIDAESMVNPPQKLYKSKEYLDGLKKEENGLRAIKDGTYRDNCLGKNLTSFQNIARKHPNILLTLKERKRFGF